MHFATYWFLGCLVKAVIGVRYKYDDYSAMISRAEALARDYPRCARKFDALETWPDLMQNYVCIILIFFSCLSIIDRASRLWVTPLLHSVDRNRK